MLDISSLEFPCFRNDHVAPWPSESERRVRGGRESSRARGLASERAREREGSRARGLASGRGCTSEMRREREASNARWSRRYQGASARCVMTAHVAWPRHTSMSRYREPTQVCHDTTAERVSPSESESRASKSLVKQEPSKNRAELEIRIHERSRSK